MATFHDLYPDLIHEFFVRITDFNTLLSAILVSKIHYQVFQDHPKSILRAVLQNLVGPAFPAAARLAHYRRWNPHISELPSEGHFAGLDWVPPRLLQPYLEKSARAFRILRDFYSQRYIGARRALHPTKLNEIPALDTRTERHQ